MNRRPLSILIGTMLLAATLPTLGGCQRGEEVRFPVSVREAPVAPPIKAPPAELLSTQSAFVEVSRKVTQSVVNIATSRLEPTRTIDPFFRDFFGDLLPQLPQRKEQSLGSGFILSADGYILTNEHVVKGAQEIKVKLSDDKVYPGRLVGVDPRTDVAVLKIEVKEPLSPVALGNSDKIRVGEWAIAIGNPFGLDRTVTVGVISAIGRANVGIEDYEDFIQTDASINPGNSGGPLLNIYGEVIGINTAIVASGQGIGFAIPVNLAQSIARQLIETGEVTRGWLGVSIQPLTPELARSFGLERTTGALVNQVLAGSPAATAGLRQGDILLTFGGKEVRGARELQLMVASTAVGHKVPVEVLRNGSKLSLTVELGSQKDATGSGQRAETAEGLGISVGPATEGVQVVAVDPASAAAAAGVREGDIILALNRREVSSPNDFAEAARRAGRGNTVSLLIRRGANSLYLAFPVK